MLTTGLLVLGRITSACWSNVLQKRTINDTSTLGDRPTALELFIAIWTLMSVALLPWWFFAIYASCVQRELAFWGWMTIACALEVPGNFLLLRSIQRTDLSIFGPLSSYKPIIGMLLGWWILAEVPTLFGLTGMAIVLGGSLLLTDRSRGVEECRDAPSSRFSSKRNSDFKTTGVQDRLIAVGLTAAGSIFLKLAMQHQNALTSLAAWSFLSWLMATAWMIVETKIQSKRSMVAPRIIRIAMKPDVFGIAACMIAMQGLTIAVFQAMYIGYALALFQLGSLVSVYLGYRVFGELDFWRRMFAATIMFVGAAIIVLAG